MTIIYTLSVMGLGVALAWTLGEIAWLLGRRGL